MPQNTPKKGNPALWIVLAVVVLSIIGAVLYYGDFFNTNTNSNTNEVVNTNTAVNQNTNTTSNTNSSTNTNTTSASESVYTNDKLGFQLELPQEWSGYTATEYIDQFPTGEERGYSSVEFEHPKKVSDQGRPGVVAFFIYYFDNPDTDVPQGVTMLGQSESIRYGYSKGNGAVPDNLYDLYLQIDDILSSFKIL